MYEDYFEDYSEFDAKIEEFKDSLRSAVKQEYRDRIEYLEKELAELKDIKTNWNAKVAELNEAKKEVELAKREAIVETRKMRLSELLKDNFLTAYAIKSSIKHVHEKCDKCDEYGYIHFKSPQGYDLKEQCKCRTEIKHIYSVTEASVVKFVSDNRSMGKTTSVYYRYEHAEKKYCYSGDCEDEDRFILTTNICDNTPFVGIRANNAIFLNKETAQAYCDYLNSKE